MELAYAATAAAVMCTLAGCGWAAFRHAGNASRLRAETSAAKRAAYLRHLNRSAMEVVEPGPKKKQDFGSRSRRR